ncbi:MAG: FAD-dependent oxidoreductase, partial [Peptoniphilaceae bacterium]|nr:FAD-dependent oxidoreductase [Peptoniphilaceae bacterium]
EKNIFVYSFCMCPGGFIVPASSEKDRLCVNGISYHNRSNTNANAAIVCAVNSEILGKETLAGIKFQRDIEEKAYKLGGGNFTAPVLRLDDYSNGRVSNKLGKIRPSYTPNYKFADLNEIYPAKINEAIKIALKDFGKKIDAFHKAMLFLQVLKREHHPLLGLKEIGITQLLNIRI